MIIIEPNFDLAMLLLRLALAAVFLAHGPMKLTKTKQVAQMMGMNANMVMLIGALEVLGALSMLLGVYTQVGAVFLGVVMVGSLYFKTQKWGKKFTGDGGWELDFMLLAGALTMLLAGPGSFAFGL